MALNIYTGSLGDTSRGSRYRNQALSAHPPNQIKRPSKQGQIVAGALARPTAFLGGCKKLPLSIPSITKPSALMVWCLLGCSGLFCGNLNSFAGKGECFFGGGPQAWAEFLWTTQSHRSHFGSRYTLGCCGHASLFCAGSIPAAFTLLQQQGKLCAVTSGLFAELHFWRLPPWLPNPAQPSAQHAQY